MKFLFKIVFVFLFVIISSQGYAQFKLSGKINNYSGKEELKINIPLVFGFDKENTTPIPIAKDGTFNITLPISESKFANLIFQRKFFTMLLNSREDLSFSLNVADTSLHLISGSALSENKVMQQVEVEEHPFFFANNQEKLSKLTYDDLQENILKPYLAQRDEKIKKVMDAPISSKEKKLIVTELKGIAYNYLNDLARVNLIDKSTISKFIIAVFDNSNPKPEVFPAGPQFYAYIDNYVRYLETKAFLKITEEKIPPSKPIPYFGISLDSANIFVKKYSKAQWRFLGAVNNLPLNVVEQYGYQIITNAIINKELRQTIDLTEAFQKLFPKSEHLITIHKQIKGLKLILAQNENNLAIKVMPNFEKTNSIYEVIKPLKGKVIYLDVWGTWCGPCKEELKFNPELKAKFKGKDVAFVYLDLDDDHLDGAWREFIKVNQMEGLHLRKTRQTIAPFWKELLANAEDKAEYYPQYFIFDKTGKLVVSKAKRPSAKEELYTQIEEFLK